LGLEFFYQPELGIALAPLALADLSGGKGIRISAEYPIKNYWNGMTEGTMYLPNSSFYTYTRGFRIRQDIRKYNTEKRIFTGISVMFKSQEIGHVAVIPENDSTNYKSNYKINKTVVSPAFLIGTNTYFGEDTSWYFEVTGYFGIRYKKSEAEGLTSREILTMWPFDVESTDFSHRFALQIGEFVYPEISATFKIGFDLSKDKLHTKRSRI
jgi:hypothetical protein